MNTREHSEMKIRGSADVSYLGRTVDEMIWNFMEKNDIPGVSLAIVQAPYIPRVVGYGLSDKKQKRLVSVNTMWPIGQISQGYTAVAIIQLYEAKKLNLDDEIGKYILCSCVPEEWKKITIRQLLHHSTGISDYRKSPEWKYDKKYSFVELIDLVRNEELKFIPDTNVEQSATNFLILTELIEVISGKTYSEFVKEGQIDFLGLKHTGFSEDLPNFEKEILSEEKPLHELFKSKGRYINPTEHAVYSDLDGKEFSSIESSAIKGFGDIWASAQDVSFWDIGLAGSILIKEPENRAIVYSSWKLLDGTVVPSSAGWNFYNHRGLMDIKGSTPGFSSFLSRFTDASELVCVTLLGNKEGVDFTNLGRRIAGAFGDLLSTKYDDNKLFLTESQFSAEITIERLEKQLKEMNIPIFAKFDHKKNAEEVGLNLRPTTVLVFGSPLVGTGLMEIDQSISLELPLRISVWEDEEGSVWVAFPRMDLVGKDYGMEKNPVISKMQGLLEKLVNKSAHLY